MVKIWKVQNTGNIPWPSGTILTCIKGDLKGESVPVPAISPGDQVSLHAYVKIPKKEGRYEGV